MKTGVLQPYWTMRHSCWIRGACISDNFVKVPNPPLHCLLLAFMEREMTFTLLWNFGVLVAIVFVLKKL
jgi:hypothetical protein